MSAPYRSHPPSRPVFDVLLAWFALATVASLFGLVERLRPPMPQIVLVLLTLALLCASRVWPPMRSFASRVDVRWLVALHLTRFVGIWFLILARQGDLARSFALPAGFGDLAVAALALALLVFVSPRSASGRRLYFAWNVLGLADILMVVALAARAAFADPDSMRTLLRFPLSLLPTFLVPLIIASHVAIASRLRRGQ